MQGAFTMRNGKDFGTELMYGARIIVGEDGADVIDYKRNATGEKLEAGVEVTLGLAFAGSFDENGQIIGEGFCVREFETADGRSGWVDQKQLIEVEPPVMVEDAE